MELRRAASAIVARDGDRGIEVLVLERGASSRFLPGYVAFPGGSIDPGDADLAERWFGSREEDARACAARELYEEVGLALVGGATADEGGGVLEGGAGLAGVSPAPEQLVEIARWVAPPRVPVRFDATFFGVRAPAGLALAPDGGETADAWWISPRVLLDEWDRGRRKLYWPTYFTMLAIEPCDGVDALLSLRIDTREPDEDELRRLPASVFWQDR